MENADGVNGTPWSDGQNVPRHALQCDPVQPCAAGESDSPAFEEHSKLNTQLRLPAAESHSPAGRAGRGLGGIYCVVSNQRIFFTCHARWQGSPPNGTVWSRSTK